jgi:hypothetical protein
MEEAKKNILLKHMNIPIDFCRYVLSEKLIKEARLYTYLSFSASGNYNVKRLDKNKILTDLGVRKWETINRHLIRLKSLGWIHSINDAWHLKSFTQITEMIGIRTATGALFDPPDFSKFKAFLIAACIKYRLQLNKWRRLKARGPYKGGSTGIAASSSQMSLAPEFPIKLALSGGDISNRYIANNLKLSQTTGHNYKVLAEEAGYIRIWKQFAPTGIKISERKAFKKYYPEVGDSLRIRGRKLFIQYPDEVESFIHLRRNRALRKLKNKFQKFESTR